MNRDGWFGTLGAWDYATDTAAMEDGLNHKGSNMHSSTASAQRAIIVHDDQSAARNWAHVLAVKGYKAQISRSGEEGLARALQHHVDLVVTGLDGTEFIQEMRRRRPHATIVVIPRCAEVRSSAATITACLPELHAPRVLAEPRNDRRDLSQSVAEEEAEAGLIRTVLRQASSDGEFGRRLLELGNGALKDVPLSSEAKTAIVWADIEWLNERCGELSADENKWIKRRIEAETW